METVGSSKLKNSLNKYLVRIKRGARFVITEHGQPIAKLLPINDSGDESVESVIAALLAEGLLSVESGIQDKKLPIPKPIVALIGSSASDLIVEERRRE